MKNNVILSTAFVAGLLSVSNIASAVEPEQEVEDQVAMQAQNDTTTMLQQQNTEGSAQVVFKEKIKDKRGELKATQPGQIAIQENRYFKSL